MFLDDFGINYMGPEEAPSRARMFAPPQSTQRPSPHDCGLVGPPSVGALERDGHLFRANRSCFAESILDYSHDALTAAIPLPASYEYKNDF